MSSYAFVENRLTIQPAVENRLTIINTPSKPACLKLFHLVDPKSYIYYLRTHEYSQTMNKLIMGFTDPRIGIPGLNILYSIY